MSNNTLPVVLERTIPVVGVNNVPYRLKNKLSFIANDSTDYALKINFDNSIDQLGTFTLYPGESVSDIEMSCNTISLQGVGGAVAVRVLGV